MSPFSELAVGADGVVRCAWPAGHADYLAYHDEEWGRPVADDVRLFEKLCLEGFQAGLSWLTILRKREAFRRAFSDFDLERVARFGPGDVQRLLADSGIVRHRGKIEAAINNARCALDVIEREGSFAALIWSFEPRHHAAPRRMGDVPARTEKSLALSRVLKQHGFRFVGPTTAYALMQSMGLVNDHLVGCAVRDIVEAARAAFERPRRVVDGAPQTRFSTRVSQ